MKLNFKKIKLTVESTKNSKNYFEWDKFIKTLNAFLLLPALILIPPLWCCWCVDVNIIFYGVLFVGLSIMKHHNVDTELISLAKRLKKP